jgi:hypothetical protein
MPSVEPTSLINFTETPMLFEICHMGRHSSTSARQHEGQAELPAYTALKHHFLDRHSAVRGDRDAQSFRIRKSAWEVPALFASSTTRLDVQNLFPALAQFLCRGCFWLLLLEVKHSQAIAKASSWNRRLPSTLQSSMVISHHSLCLVALANTIPFEGINHADRKECDFLASFYPYHGVGHALQR